MAQRKPFAIGKEEDASYIVAVDETLTLTDLPPEKKGTVDDRRDMHRMGKAQVCITPPPPPHPKKEKKERKRKERESNPTNNIFFPFFTPSTQQEFRRNFSFIPIFGFAATLMMTWASVLSSASYVLPNGGLPAMIWMYLVTLVGFGCAIFCMAEMASMAPTSGGQVRVLFFILSFPCVSCVSFLFSLFFSFLWGFFLSSRYELADKSGKKRLICGNLVSLVCDDDVVYLIYIHICMCVRT